MKRHKCTKCRKKRLEKFLKPVRESDKPGSMTWICKDNCLDGRWNKKAQSYLQEGQSLGSKGLSNQDLRMSDDSLARSNVATMANVPGGKYILDVCCGHKMFWFNKENPHVIFSDMKSDVDPDIVQDFRKLQYPNESFYLVVYDPPHLFSRDGKFSWLNNKYGTLDPDQWPLDIKQGFDECMRVLKSFGILIFKWSEGSISVSTILSIFKTKPLFGHTSDKKGKTHWMCFMKVPEE